VSTKAGTTLVQATQRVNAEVAEGWSLLVRLTATADNPNVLAAARKAMQSIYQRVPTHSSDHDGRILAMVQQVIANRTRTYLQGARAPGQLRSAAAAGQALLTTTFELSVPSVEDARRIHLRAYALPASPHTETALAVGTSAVVVTFPDVDDAERLRSLEDTTDRARRAGGFAGPFGIQLTDDARRMAHRVLGQFDRFLHEHLTHFSLPGVKLDADPADRLLVNVGNAAAVPADPLGSGQAHRPLLPSGRGGAAVVLRGRESRSDGEGRHRTSSALGWREIAGEHQRVALGPG
jgi:hypothetical protein